MATNARTGNNRPLSDAAADVDHVTTTAPQTSTRDYALATQLLHVGKPELVNGTAPVNVPIERTSTVQYSDLGIHTELLRRRNGGEHVAYYGRHGTRTHRALEEAIATLEDATDVFLVPSGLAAISVVLIALLCPGDHVLMQDGAYGGLHDRVVPLLQRLRIKVTTFAPSDDNLESHLQAQTKLVYVESPGSTLFEMVDIPQFSEFSRARGLKLVADNTWGAGLLHQPLALGADVSIQAATKYIGGHSDLMQGVISVRDAEMSRRIISTYDALGMSVGADDAYMALRGVRTLQVRLAQHAHNALAVATFLASHPAVSRVYHPALPSDQGHTLWRRDFKGANGLVSIALRGAQPTDVTRFLNKLQIFGLGASWGGYESLALPASLVSLQRQRYWDGGDPVVRLHVGLENTDDLISDLGQALRYALPA